MLCTAQYVCVCDYECADGSEDNCRFSSLPVLLFGLLVEHRNRAVSLINMNNGALVCFHCKLQKIMSALHTCLDTYCMCVCASVCVPRLAWQYFMHDSHRANKIAIKYLLFRICM